MHSRRLHQNALTFCLFFYFIIDFFEKKTIAWKNLWWVIFWDWKKNLLKNKKLFFDNWNIHFHILKCLFSPIYIHLWGERFFFCQKLGYVMQPTLHFWKPAIEPLVSAQVLTNTTRYSFCPHYCCLILPFLSTVVCQLKKPFIFFKTFWMVYWHFFFKLLSTFAVFGG